MKKCLIVDDCREDSNLAARYLRKIGFQVKHARDGHEALNICQRNMPDVILVEHVMPKVDGLEFLKRLNQTHGRIRPVVLFCSEDGDAGALGSALWRGASECLIKPFDADLLDFKLHQIGVLVEPDAVAV